LWEMSRKGVQGVGHLFGVLPAVEIGQFTRLFALPLTKHLRIFFSCTITGLSLKLCGLILSRAPFVDSCIYHVAVPSQPVLRPVRVANRYLRKRMDSTDSLICEVKREGHALWHRCGKPNTDCAVRSHSKGRRRLFNVRNLLQEMLEHSGTVLSQRTR